MSSTLTERTGSLDRQITPEESVAKETSEKVVVFFEIGPDRRPILRKYPPESAARLSIGIPPKGSNEPYRIAFARRSIAESIVFHGGLDALASPPNSEAKVVRAQLDKVQKRKNVKGVRMVTCLRVHPNDVQRLPGLYISPQEIIDEEAKETILKALKAEKLFFATDPSTEELAANAKRNELINTRGEPRAAVRARLQTSE